MISRASLVYVDVTILGHKPYLSRWLNDKPEDEKVYWKRLCEKYVDDCVSLVLGSNRSANNSRTILPQSSLNMVIEAKVK